MPESMRGSLLRSTGSETKKGWIRRDEGGERKSYQQSLKGTLWVLGKKRTSQKGKSGFL